MKRLCSLVVFVLLSMDPLFGQGTNPAEQAESHVGQLVAEGGRLVAEGNINAALEKFRQAHNLAPDEVEAIIGLARVESLHKDDSGKVDMQAHALADYQTALTMQPTPELYTELGVLFDNKQDHGAAIKAYKKALDLNPQFFSAELYYGNALMSIGDFDNAISVYSKACAHSSSVHPGTATGCGSVEILANRGVAYLKKGDCRSLSLAEKDFSEAASLEPGSADLHGKLGHVLMGEGMENLSHCANSKQERKDYLERAWSEFRIAINLNSADTLNRASFVALSEVLKRKPEYNGGIAKEPDEAELSQLLADHPELVSKPTDSLESLESLEDRQLNAQHNKALTDAKEGVRLKPTDGYAWYALGKAYMDLDDYASAEDPFKRALKALLAAGPDRPGHPLREQTSLLMAANATFALAQVCDKLHRKREAEHYRRSYLMLLESTH
jgi:tetratricopeptide (TPR) repeat protein